MFAKGSAGEEACDRRKVQEGRPTELLVRAYRTRDSGLGTQDSLASRSADGFAFGDRSSDDIHLPTPHRSRSCIGASEIFRQTFLSGKLHQKFETRGSSQWAVTCDSIFSSHSLHASLPTTPATMASDPRRRAPPPPPPPPPPEAEPDTTTRELDGVADDFSPEPEPIQQQQQQQQDRQQTNGEEAGVREPDDGYKLKFCTVCASNNNRSMEA